MKRLLAFDTSGDRTHIAVADGERVWSHEAAGGAAASAQLIPGILRLLDDAGMTLRELDAIAFGRGPGAFTGLRTACAVAQGLAFGAGLQVLPVDTLCAVAEDARAGHDAMNVWAVIDARMGEIYAAEYRHAAGRWQTLKVPVLTSPTALNERWSEEAPHVVAGNALGAFRDRLAVGAARLVPAALPRAAAIIAVARQRWEEGGAVDPARALPLYLRDKVAQTTAERAAIALGSVALPDTAARRPA